MRRKIASLLALAVLVTTMYGCTQQAAQTTEAPTTAPQTTQAPPDGGDSEGAATDLKIGVTLYARDQFISILEQGIVNAANIAGVSVDVQDAQNDVQKQMDQINSFVTQKCDAIIVNLVNTDTAEDIIKTVGDTPLIFVNRRPDDSVLREGKDAYVGSQETDAGKMQAEYLTKYFNDKGQKEIEYILFQGQLGLENTQARTDSVKEQLVENGFTLNKVFEDTAEWDRAKAMEKMNQILGTGKSFDVVICNNDEMALGVIEAMKVAGVDPMPPVCGIDATADALQAIEDGTMAMSVFQDAAGQGAECIGAAMLAAEGKLTQQFGWVPFLPVTSENLADFK